MPLSIDEYTNKECTKSKFNNAIATIFKNNLCNFN